MNKNLNYGILITSLPALYNKKTNDKKMTILEYTISNVIKNDINIFNFMSDFQLFEIINLNLIIDSFNFID